MVMPLIYDPDDHDIDDHASVLHIAEIAAYCTDALKCEAKLHFGG